MSNPSEICLDLMKNASAAMLMLWGLSGAAQAAGFCEKLLDINLRDVDYIYSESKNSREYKSQFCGEFTKKIKDSGGLDFSIDDVIFKSSNNKAKEATEKWCNNTLSTSNDFSLIESFLSVVNPYLGQAVVNCSKLTDNDRLRVKYIEPQNGENESNLIVGIEVLRTTYFENADPVETGLNNCRFMSDVKGKEIVPTGGPYVVSILCGRDKGQCPKRWPSAELTVLTRDPGPVKLASLSAVPRAEFEEVEVFRWVNEGASTTSWPMDSACSRATNEVLPCNADNLDRSVVSTGDGRAKSDQGGKTWMVVGARTQNDGTQLGFGLRYNCPASPPGVESTAVTTFVCRKVKIQQPRKCG